MDVFVSKKNLNYMSNPNSGTNVAPQRLSQSKMHIQHFVFIFAFLFCTISHIFCIFPVMLKSM